MALEIFRLVGSVFVDTDKADKSLKKTDKSAKGFGDSLVSVVKSAGKFAAGVAGAATAAGGAILALTESTRDYRTEQGKLKTAFDVQNFSAAIGTQSVWKFDYPQAGVSTLQQVRDAFGSPKGFLSDYFKGNFPSGLSPDGTFNMSICNLAGDEIDFIDAAKKVSVLTTKEDLG